jgi:hypothetical protein
MLRYNETKEEVEINPDAIEIPAVNDLWRNDKIGDKSFFKKVCKWTYHMYYREHSLANLPYQERKTIVIESYFNGKMPSNIDGNKRVIAFTELYNFLQKGIEERLAETIKEAIALEKERISSLDTKIKERIEIPYNLSHDFDIYKKNEDGKFIKLKAYELTGVVRKEVDLNDSSILIKEVEKAFKLSTQYEEAVRRATIEREELKQKYDGISILEKYHSLSSEAQKNFLKKSV